MSADGTVRRRDALLQWRDWSLTTKLAAVVLVPVISAITLGIGQVRWQVDRADEFNRIERVLDVVDHVEPVVEQLQNERTGAVQYLTRDGAPIDGQTAASDQAVGALRQAFADPAALGPVVRDRYAELQGALGKLAGLRQQVSNRQLQPVDAVHAYSELIGAVVSVDRALTTAITDPDLSSNATALQTVLSTMEEVRLQQALVLTGLTDGELSSSTVTELSASHARLQMLIAEGRSTVSTKWSHRLDAVVSSPEVAQRNGLLTKIIEESTDNKHGGSYSVNRQTWNQLSDASVAQINSGHDDLAKEVRDSAFRLEDDASNSAGWDSVLLLSALIAAAAIIIVITRQLLRSLHQLRRSALDAAEYELPEAVDRIRAGAKDTDLEPVPVDTSDEIGQVARAFDAVNRQALRLAAEQSDLRRGYSEVFVSVSRRSQGLLERQLRLFEELEQDEEDPDQLSRLFQLDHLATRMRRNNENLMVLSGSDLARRFTKPTELADVVRAAVSEIEQYPRVVVQQLPSVKLRGNTASDMVRLVAELLDNAANFSAPDTTVSASGYQAGDGSVVVDVLDQGIGMGHEELAAANERLTRVDESDLATSRRMGLFVAGRLAVRHNIGVELHGGPDVEGVRATITVPAEHVVSGDPRTEQQQPAAVQPGRRNGHSHQDLPTSGTLPPRSPNPPAEESPWQEPSPASLFEPTGADHADSPTAHLFDSPLDIPQQPRTVPPDLGVDWPAADPVPAEPPQDPEPVVSDSSWFQPAAENPYLQSNAEQPRWPGSEPEPEPQPAPDPEPASGAAVSQEAPLTPSGLPRRIPRGQNAQQAPAEQPGGATRSPSDISRRLAEYHNGVQFGQSAAAEPSEPAVEPETEAWNFAADQGRQAAEAAANPQPSSFTPAGLPRRTPKAHLVPGSIAAENDDTASGQYQRDPNQLRGRLADFQSGIRRGRHRATDED